MTAGQAALTLLEMPFDEPGPTEDAAGETAPAKPARRKRRRDKAAAQTDPGGEGEGEVEGQPTPVKPVKRKPAKDEDSLTDHEASMGFASVCGPFLAWTDCDDGYERGRWWEWSDTARRWQMLPGPPSRQFYNCLGSVGADGWGVSRVEGCMRHARRQMHVETSEWDADGHLLGHPDGTVTDLRTGDRRPQEAADRIRRATGTVPDDNAEAVAWVREHILELACGRPGLAAYMTRTLGAGCVGSNADQLINLWTGEGANGKSTLLDAATRALGGYATVGAKTLLCDTGREDHPTNLADVIGPGRSGPRLISASEPNHLLPWSEDMLRALSGGDELKARRMRQDYSTGYCVGEVVVSVNTLPVLREINYAIVRRIRVTPFDLRFTEEEADTSMPEQWAERSGALLAVMIEAAKQVVAEHAAGIVADTPEEVRKASARYIDQHRAVEMWAEECLVSHTGPTAGEHELISDDAVAHYTRWCHSHGFSALDARWQNTKGGRVGMADRLHKYFAKQGADQVRRQGNDYRGSARLIGVSFAKHLKPVPEPSDPVPPAAGGAGTSITELAKMI